MVKIRSLSIITSSSYFSIHFRDSRLCLVLVQRRASSPVSDNKLAAERAHELTQACEIPLKALFVLQYTEHLLGFIMR